MKACEYQKERKISFWYIQGVKENNKIKTRHAFQAL